MTNALGSEPSSPSATSHRQNPRHVDKHPAQRRGGVIIPVGGQGVAQVPRAEVGGTQAGQLTGEVGKLGGLGTVRGVGQNGGDHGQVGPAGGVAGGRASSELFGGQPPAGQCLERTGSGLPDV